MSQLSGTDESQRVCAASLAAKFSSSFALSSLLCGFTPSILMKRAPARSANLSIRVDFPTRRRPLHVTSDAVRFLNRPSSLSIKSSRPKNMVLSLGLRDGGILL